MKTALVTGGAGFIGSHVVDKLLGRGWKVRVLDDLSSGRLENLGTNMSHIDFVQGSITENSTVDAVCRGVDAVFHLAASIFVPESFLHPAKYNDVNTSGAILVHQAASRHGVKRMVLSSTCAIYGDSAELPVNEQAKVLPLSPYAISKYAAEMYCHSLATLGGTSTPVTVLRYFNVYGPRQNPSSPYSGVISKYVSLAKANASMLPVYGDGLQTRDFIHVEDVATANYLAAEHDRGQFAIYNAGTGIETSINDLIACLASAAERPLQPEYHPSRNGDIKRSQAGIELIKTNLGFRPVMDMKNGIKSLWTT